MPSKLLPKRPGDSDLENPPSGVQISLFHLVGKHWSDAIVGDSRPKTMDIADARGETKPAD